MFKRTTTIAIVLLSFMSLAAQNQDAPNSTVASPAKFELLWHEAKALLPTRMIYPPGFDAKHARTLIVALHGYGGSAEAFQSTVGKLASGGFVVAVPEAPYPMLVQGKLGYDWTLHQQEDYALEKKAFTLAGLDHLPEVVSDLRRRYRVDRVYLLGFSQGASLALLTGIHNNGLFDGIVSFALPFFDTSWFGGNLLAAGNGVPVLLVHGQEDIWPIEVSQRARDALKNAGYDVTLRPFVGGHTVPNDQLDFAAKWMRDVGR